MLRIFRTQLLMLLRERSLIFWAIAFPVALLLIMSVTFANLDGAYRISPQPFGVVDDGRLSAFPLIEQVLEKAGEADSDERIIDLARFADEGAAAEALESGAVIGYVSAGSDGPVVHRGSAAGFQADAALRVLSSALDAAGQSASLIGILAREGADPQAAASALDSAQGAELLREVQLTAAPADPAVRYYYALLAFACGMGMSFAFSTVRTLIPAASPLGARMSLAGMARWRVLAGSLLAAWACILASLLVVFALMLAVTKADFGPRSPLAIGAIALGSLMACSAGALLGSFPRIRDGALISGITCLLSLFTGLYGTPSQQLADSIARSAPLLAWANPLWNTAQCFFDLMYYDDLGPLAANLGIMLCMSAAFFALAAVRLRRTSHEHR